MLPGVGRSIRARLLDVNILHPNTTYEFDQCAFLELLTHVGIGALLLLRFSIKRRVFRNFENILLYSMQGENMAVGQEKIFHRRNIEGATPSTPPVHYIYSSLQNPSNCCSSHCLHVS